MLGFLSPVGSEVSVAVKSETRSLVGSATVARLEKVKSLQPKTFAEFLAASREVNVAQSQSRGVKVLAMAGRVLDPPVGIDTGMALNLVSDDLATRQAALARLGNAELVMSRTAREEFRVIVDRWAGPLEKARADELLERVRRVGDNWSGRAARLRETGNIEASDIDILGTYDWLDIPAFTTDARAIRAAGAQGVQFNVTLVPAGRLTGR